MTSSGAKPLWAFVQMVNAWDDAQGSQGFDAADAEDQFLANPRADIAAVETRSQFAILWPIAFDIAVEQVQRNASDAHEPDSCLQLAVERVDRNRDRIALGIAGRFHRHVFDLGVEVFFLLPAFAVEVLPEIALVVE